MGQHELLVDGPGRCGKESGEGESVLKCFYGHVLDRGRSCFEFSGGNRPSEAGFGVSAYGDGERIENEASERGGKVLSFSNRDRMQRREQALRDRCLS